MGRADNGQLSYVVWEEGGRYPDVIVELTSKTTEKVDRGSKFVLYRDVFQTAEYYLYHPLTRHFEGYRLHAGQYVGLPAHPDGSLDCATLGLRLRVMGGWLRWVDPNGRMLLTGEEWAEEERRKAEAERARAEAAEAEVARLRGLLSRPPE
jgi:hypothetical protein